MFRAITLSALTVLCAPILSQAQPAPSAAASAASQADAGVFVQDLANRTFSVLRNQSQTDVQRKAQFRQMLRENFAISRIGDRLIARHRSAITPQQHRAYVAAFPDFVINTYADRLTQYTGAQFRVTRSTPRGRRGDVDVASRVSLPGGGQPIDAVWTLTRADNRWLVSNLTVAGINLALTQEADFNSYIQRNGFDALVAFMQRSGSPA